jgi:hypothetical protein
MKSTEFGGFYKKNKILKFGQILSGNSNFGRPKSTKIPEFCPFRSEPIKTKTEIQIPGGE